MAKREVKMSEFQAFRVYHDEKGQAVYLPFMSKDGYILISKDIGQFNIHSMRVPLAVMLGGIIFMFGHRLLGVLAGLALLVVWEIYMRKKYLSTLPVVKDFVKPTPKQEKERFQKLQGDNGKKNNEGIGNSIIMVILGTAFCIVSYINVQQQGFTGFTLYMNYGLSLAGFCIAFYYLLDIIKKLIEKGKKK